MKRKVIIALLGLGTVVGYGAGVARLACAKGGFGGHTARRAAFERHVADVCVDAALRAAPRPPPATP